ncbi:DUF6069 family protein [Dactylosporangium sp. NPDC049525]|uniref:DUF6069 family protein n=1 Tax=Dactylosporangium sp. NPDC049525 TaxID=3154730 RepID=UPI00342EE569
MTASTEVTPGSTAQGKWKGRLIVVAVAAAAAMLVFLVESAVLDAVKTPAMNGQQSSDVNAGFVFVLVAIVSLVAWGLLALLEKITARARLIWTIIAAVVLLLSVGGPLSGEGITTGNRIGLLLLHVTVAVVLIPFLPSGFRRSN